MSKTNTTKKPSIHQSGGDTPKINSTGFSFGATWMEYDQQHEQRLRHIHRKKKKGEGIRSVEREQHLEDVDAYVLTFHYVGEYPRTIFGK